MSAFHPRGEAHVDPLDFFGEHEGARAEADGEEFGVEFAHALGEGGHFGGGEWG